MPSSADNDVYCYGRNDNLANNYIAKILRLVNCKLIHFPIFK